ncbi:MAG TPA: DNA mismatch repair protein MutS [Patescibacteria group bacterium]|nr:DNA mismatch repair protein MutS [Patescibacteria group bacterium]
MESHRPDPRAEYTRRLDDRRAAAARQARLDLRMSNARLAVIVAAALVAWLAWGAEVLSAWWLVAPMLGFVLLVVAHERVVRARRRCERAVAFYERGLARLDDRWAGQGTSGERFLDEEHLYAADLDLFGRGSLFELLCTARTRAGEETLAGWLRAPATPDEVRARQAAVDELRGHLDLREDLSLLGAEVRAGVHPVALSAWGTAPPVLVSRANRLVAPLLAAAGVAAVSLWLAGVIGPTLVIAALFVELAFALPLRARVLQVIGEVDLAAHELDLLAQLLGRLEQENYRCARLVELRAALDTEAEPPSRRIAKLRRLIDLLDSRRNQLFAPVSFLLLWATQLAHAIEAWRAASGPAVPRWLAAVGEIEALCALAGYAFENPGDPFAEIVSPEDGPLFEGVGLGHPLIPEQRCVPNDVRLGGPGCPLLMVVSGSNMSGKSTLLRSVGANTVLALAGGPVRARRLRLTPLAVGATLRIQDSLQAGTSRFYAEITRLRNVVDLTRSAPPPLFLLDEMLNGTNSHDRRIGAEAVVRGLIDRGAIGLVTTHDLALSQIAESLAPRAANVHFEDHLENGQMSFDYIMRPGIMTKSNALALMRAVGLDI